MTCLGNGVISYIEPNDMTVTTISKVFNSVFCLLMACNMYIIENNCVNKLSVEAFLAHY